MKNLFILILVSILCSFNLYSQWEQCNGGEFSGHISCTAVDNNIIYAGTAYGGMFASYDNGISWTHTSFPNKSVSCLTVEKSVIYAGTWSDGVYVSYDYAKTWEKLHSDIFDNVSISSIDKDLNMIVIGVWSSSTIIISTDHGNNWTVSNTGFTPTYNLNILIVGSIIYIATYDHGILASTNYGYTWVQKNSGISGINANQINVLVYRNDVIYAGTFSGLYTSADYGNSWQKFTQAPNIINVKDIAFINNTIYALVQEYLYMSTDNGISWTQLYYTNESEDLTCLSVINNLLFLGKSYTGIYLSDDNFQTWTSHLSGLKELNINSLAVDWNNIFAGDAFEGVFQSTDNGESWNLKNNGMDNKHVMSLFVKNSFLFAGCLRNLYRSSNNGDTWAEISKGLADSTVNCFMDLGDSIYAGTWDGIYLSTDNGDTWISKSYGLNNEGFLSLDHKGSFFCTGTANGNGVFISTDYGESWRQKSLGNNASIYSIIIDDTLIIAGTGSQGIFISSDQGNSWTQRKEGLKDAWVMTLKKIGNTIFVGTLDGACTTTDYGLNWVYPAADELKYSYVHAFNNNDEFVFAATNGDGIYRAKIKDMVLDVTEPILSNNSFSVCPNPANDVITININNNDYVENQLLEIYNSLGEKMLSCYINANNGTEINISDLFTGVYIIRYKSMSSVFVKQ